MLNPIQLKYIYIAIQFFNRWEWRMTLVNVNCPHCGASSSGSVAFCESCGKAMPAAISTGPRVLAGDELPTSAAATKLVGDELKKQTKSAATTLLVVSIIQLAIGGIVVLIVMNAPRANRSTVNLPFLIASTVGLGVIFMGLYIWARHSPLPPTIVGLVVYCTLVAINMVSSISRLAESGQNQPGNGIGGIGIGWLDIVIIAVLARGISAALKSRKLSAAETH